MNNERDILWRGLKPLLNAFANRIASFDSAVTYSIGSTSNSSFLLRGYVSLKKATDGEEIAVTVDAALGTDIIAVSSDVCIGDGEILAEGPAASLRLSATSLETEAEIASWLELFQDFLATIEAIVRTRVAAL